MKSFFDKINILILVMGLVLSPLQMSFASTMKCSDASTMQQHQNQLEHTSLLNKTGQNCCSQNQCASAHCPATSVALSENTIGTNSNSAGNKTGVFDKAFINYFNTSIYRPPIF
ncbi:MAG: hypothetical protein ACC653_04795 [Gammaproteobacteria bacterium]